jgi:hypothetical protein
MIELQYPAVIAISQMCVLYVVSTRPKRKFAAATSSTQTAGALVAGGVKGFSMTHWQSCQKMRALLSECA